MKIAITCVLLAAAFLIASSAGAAETKSAGKAMALSAVIPGSGQMYAGEAGRGAVILAAEVFLFSQMRNPSSDADTAGLAAGFALVTLHILQIGDAGRVAEKADLSALRRKRDTPNLSFDVDIVSRWAMVRKTWRF